MATRHFGAAALLGLSLLVGGMAATPASAGSDHQRYDRDGYRYDRGGWYDGHGSYHRYDREGYRHNRDGWYDRHGSYHRFG